MINVISLFTFSVIMSGVVSDTQLCDEQKSVELVNRSYNGIAFKDDEIMLSKITGQERGCACLKRTCASKCCPFGSVYNNRYECVPKPHVFEPKVWTAINGTNVLLKELNATKELIFMFDRINCTEDEGKIPASVLSENFYLLNDGNLYVAIPNNIPDTLIYEPNKYCLDTFVSEDGKSQLNALICFAPKPEKTDFEVSSSCMLISCFFILLTVAVYAWLPELRNLHGMVLMAYLLSFFVGFLFLATMQIMLMRKEINQDTCVVLTFIIYFSLLSAFFWLNVMCYDIWRTFSGKRAHGRSGAQNKRFFHYAIYAFGVPTALTILMAALEFADLPVQHSLLPKIRLQGCFLYGNSKLLYLYGPIVVLCLVNMTFFTLTVFKIRRETQLLHSRESSTNDQDRKDTKRFTLYLKLFAVMGVSWILEVVSSFYPEADVYWQFSDAYNVLVGLIIFIIFVCNKKTWKMIKKRYAQMKGKPMTRSKTNSHSTRSISSSKDDLPMNSIKE